MTSLQAALAVIVGLFALAGLGGGLWAAFRSAAQDARIKRLQGERDDYLSRLNYIEPRLKQIEDHNKLLLELHNPAEQIEHLRAQEQDNHDETYKLLESTHRTLQAIDRHLLHQGGGDR